MPIYAHYGVRHTWMVDPGIHILAIFELHDGSWVEIGRYSAYDTVSAAPFDAVAIELGRLCR